MRLALAALMCLPTLAMAQTQPAPPQPGFQRGGPITRDQFIQRAAVMAGHRFDMIDTAHAGTITRDQLRAWRQAHAGQGRMQQPLQ